VAGGQATKRADADAPFRWVDDPTKGVYAATVNFTEAGDWGLQALAAAPQGPPQQLRANFKVLDKGAAPTIGAQAPRSRNPLVADVGGDATKLCTNAPPCNLHDLRIADALAAGKPTFILFASPGFCVSRTCAPMLGEVLKLRDSHAEQASFIHIEIYKDPQNRVVADTVNEWGLASEPWMFVIDRAGKVADRMEGTAALDELEASLKTAL
jgi:hypothetical protein